jgi:hypothetical protein
VRIQLGRLSSLNQAAYNLLIRHDSPELWLWILLTINLFLHGLRIYDHTCIELQRIC